MRQHGPEPPQVGRYADVLAERRHVPFDEGTDEGALPEHYGVLLNVVLFVPLGAFLVLITGRAWWWVTLLAAAGSGAIEIVQGLWLAREATWSDVLANTLGACVGAVLVSLLARGLRPPTSRAAPARHS
jgi:glycopeptide antibiotics resistance protein